MTDLIQTRDFVICKTHQDESVMDECLHCRIAELESRLRKILHKRNAEAKRYVNRIKQTEAKLEAARVFATSHIHLKDGEAFIKVRRDVYLKALGEGK